MTRTIHLTYNKKSYSIELVDNKILNKNQEILCDTGKFIGYKKVLLDNFHSTELIEEKSDFFTINADRHIYKLCVLNQLSLGVVNAIIVENRIKDFSPIITNSLFLITTTINFITSLCYMAGRNSYRVYGDYKTLIDDTKLYILQEKADDYIVDKIEEYKQQDTPDYNSLSLFGVTSCPLDIRPIVNEEGYYLYFYRNQLSDEVHYVLKDIDTSKILYRSFSLLDSADTLDGEIKAYSQDVHIDITPIPITVHLHNFEALHSIGRANLNFTQINQDLSAEILKSYSYYCLGAKVSFIVTEYQAEELKKVIYSAVRSVDEETLYMIITVSRPYTVYEGTPQSLGIQLDAIPCNRYSWQ